MPSQVVGAWSTVAERAGGCLNHPDTFINNPQYRFDVDKDEGEAVIIQGRRNLTNIYAFTSYLILSVEYLPNCYHIFTQNFYSKSLPKFLPKF
jgi:hypothetical protein